MSEKVTLENTLPGGFGLPTGQVIPGHGSITVEPKIWQASKDHPVVAAQVKAGAIIVDGKGKKKPDAGAARDENGDTPEMAEMRKRFDASFAALRTELNTEKGKVADLQNALAERDERIAALTQGTGGDRPAGYVVTDKGSGWFVITKDGDEVTKSLRRDVVADFDAKSDDEKAAFVAANKPD